MPNCPPTLSFVDPGSFPRLPASLAGISAEVHSCKGGSMGRLRSLQGSRSAQKMYRDNDEANPCMVPTNILEGPYPNTTDINITPELVAACLSTLSHPWGCRASLGSWFLGCPGFAVGRVCSIDAQGEQRQPSVTPAQLQWHEQARF